jgi:acyl-CoA synthetase
MTNTVLSLLDAERRADFYRRGFWRDETLYALAKRQAERNPDKFAIRDSHRRLTYAQLIAEVDALAADMAWRGVRAGQRVAVWLPSRIESAIALLACSRNGYICCPSLHRDQTVAGVVALLRRIDASILIVQPGYGADGDKADTRTQALSVASLKQVYALAHAREVRGPGIFGAPIDSGLPTAMSSANADQIMYLAFTSGTTGEPKGVMHSDNTLLATARTVAVDWKFDADTVVYTLSPPSHNLGLGAVILAVLIGGEVVLHDLPRGRSLLDRLSETSATYLIGVPTHAIDLLAELRARGIRKMAGLRGFRISGAAAPPQVVADLLACGIVPQSGYGMTETCSHHYTLPHDDLRLIVETCGRACDGYEVRIFKRDDLDKEVSPGEIGQIGGRGASLMLGYFNDPDTTERSFNKHGWFMTGDLGWLDDNKYLRITGREKDVIIRGGHNIYPAKIEALASRHQAAQQVVVFPIADPRLGEKVCLALKVRDGLAVTGDEMLAHLDQVGLSKYDMPEYFVLVDDFPKTSSGKLLKRELVEWARDGRLSLQPVRWKPGVSAGSRGAH